MTKFCTNCGKKLDEGQKCTCEKIKRDSKTYDSPKQEQSDLLHIIEDFASRPVNTLENLKNYHFNSYILLIIASLVTGLLGTIFKLGRWNCNIITTSVVTFIFLIILTFITYLLFQSYKKIEFKDTLEIIAVSSITLTIGFFVSFLISFLSSFLSLILISSTILLFIINIYHGLIINDIGNKNKTGYLLICSIILSLFVLVLFLTAI